MATVQQFEELLSQLMGDTACQEPGILRRLIALVQQLDPQLDQRVARKLASTRLQLRIRQLNKAGAYPGFAQGRGQSE